MNEQIERKLKLNQKRNSGTGYTTANVMGKTEHAVNINTEQRYPVSEQENKVSPAITDRVAFDTAITIISKQMQATGRRETSINSMQQILGYFVRDMQVEYVDEVTQSMLFDWLGMMQVKDVTKHHRIKIVKGFLNRCLSNGFISSNVWNNVTVKVDAEIKKGASEQEVKLLLSMLDLNRYVELRDYVAISIMYNCGLRVNTLISMEESCFDPVNLMLHLGGDIMKNHQPLLLPVSPELGSAISALIAENAVVRKEHRRYYSKQYLMLARDGRKMADTSMNNSTIQRRITYYMKTYGFTSIQPHNLRRAYAKNLLVKGASVLQISKALNHKSLQSTSQYLYLDMEENAESLRKFL